MCYRRTETRTQDTGAEVRICDPRPREYQGSIELPGATDTRSRSLEITYYKRQEQSFPDSDSQDDTLDPAIMLTPLTALSDPICVLLV